VGLASPLRKRSPEPNHANPNIDVGTAFLGSVLSIEPKLPLETHHNSASHAVCLQVLEGLSNKF
jgi:hypothetical protein